MTRMVEEERTQLGTLKALGYSNKMISSKYLLYAAVASLIGVIFGIIIGSIGVPIAVAAKKSFIVPSATMTIHPVRHSGTVLGVSQTMDYLQAIQDRITGFVTENSKI